MQNLQSTLSRINRRGYKAYQDIEGGYKFKTHDLIIDRVQGDPFASPSRVRLWVPQSVAGFDSGLFSNKIRNVGLCDYLTREFGKNIHRFVRGRRGIGTSGEVFIDRPGQEILERSSIIINEKFVEARICVGLPAAGRTVLADEAWAVLSDELCQLVFHSLVFNNLHKDTLVKHIESAEDQESLRIIIASKNLVAFIANNSLLPRTSGIDDRPLKDGLRFKSPTELETTIILPNKGMVSGMGIPAGVTLITGGGYHGKTTVLKAIQHGIYNHIPGDGRELVVTIPDAVKIRAEDGRRVEGVDISPFINNLPLGRKTTNFSTDNASGSTSQAANIVEALEMGARLLLIDEDTTATNFMIRDRRMQALVAKEKEPITPFIDRVQGLYETHGVSTIVVIGGCGDYLDVADIVLRMEEYEPFVVTDEAKKIASIYPTGRVFEGGISLDKIKHRIPVASSFDASRGRNDVKISVKDLHTIIYGTQVIDLIGIEQLVDESQTRFIAQAIYILSQRYMQDNRTLSQIIDNLLMDISRDSFDILDRQPHGNYAISRKYELAAAINRLRSVGRR
ncbi:MAG: ABC-ATPase domain-containing protein [Candidatus Desantisbacteria bacterium]